LIFQNLNPDKPVAHKSYRLDQTYLRNNTTPSWDAVLLLAVV